MVSFVKNIGRIPINQDNLDSKMKAVVKLLKKYRIFLHFLKNSYLKVYIFFFFQLNVYNYNVQDVIRYQMLLWI